MGSTEKSSAEAQNEVTANRAVVVASLGPRRCWGGRLGVDARIGVDERAGAVQGHRHGLSSAGRARSMSRGLATRGS